jgi:serine protease Do
VLGGVIGALGTEYFMDSRENTVSTDEEASTNLYVAEEAAYIEEIQEAEETGNKLLPADIYKLACEETVSISVEMVSYDRFGNQIPSTISGSGFIISDDGYILTNYHVVEEAVLGGFHVTVTAYDGSVYIGRIAGADEDADVAVIKIEKENSRHVTLGNSEELTVGDEIFVVGNPYGMLEFSMTTGHISALDREIATEENENALNMFQIDAAVYSGNSGGPVYNESGSVVGIVTAKYNSSGMEGIGFALPINDVLPIVNELIDKGYVSGKASLGVSFDSRYNTVYSRYYRLPDGAFVSLVDEGSCAEKAGIQQGDILMQIGEYTIEEYSDVTAILRHFSAGESAEIRLYRDGQILSVTLSFDEAIPASLKNNT